MGVKVDVVAIELSLSMSSAIRVLSTSVTWNDEGPACCSRCTSEGTFADTVLDRGDKLIGGAVELGVVACIVCPRWRVRARGI
jgi:hypothetical protein